MSTRSRFVFLQHPREARNPVGTARMAHLTLRESRLLVGVDFASCLDFEHLLEEERERSVVLYPAPGARDARELAGREPPPTIWIVDGTWWQAQKIWKRNPALRALPAYRLEPRQPSQYGFRSEPAPHCVSTIEAVAELVELLEGVPGSYEALLAPFRALVQRQTSFARSPERAPRRRSRSRPPRQVRLPEPLDVHPERAVLFVAEGNGWPAGTDPRPPTELLYAAAVRPASGERLGAFVRPERLSPTALDHLSVLPDVLAGAISAEELAARWRAFTRPDDVLCGWGHFSAGLLARAGAGLPPHVDLKIACTHRLRARAGRIEEAYRVLGLAPPPATPHGRGAMRLAMLEAIWGLLLRGEIHDGSRHGWHRRG